jgi:uncharacterized protein (TIGR03067 family)
MARAVSLIVLVAVGPAIFADGPAGDAAERDRKALVGTWTVVSVEANGQKIPDEAIKDFQFIFTPESLTRKKGGKAESGAGYRLDPSKSPKWIDMTGTTDGKERAVPALYELSGDTLKLCFRNDYKSKDGKPAEDPKRPAKLEGGANSMQVLMVLRREKP